MGKDKCVNLGGHIIDAGLCQKWECDHSIIEKYEGKIEGRFISLLHTANFTKDYIHMVVGIEKFDSIHVDTHALAKAVIKYFDAISRFKVDHGYGSNLINNAKVAAFTSIKIMEEKPIKLTGDVPDVVLGGVVNANSIFAYRFILNSLGIMPKEVPAKVAKDLLYCLQMKHNQDPEVFYLTMLFLEAAYGGPSLCRRVMRFCRKGQNLLSTQVA